MFDIVIPILFQFFFKGECDRKTCLELESMLYLKSPQTTNVIAALKADGLQALVKAGLDAGKTRGPCSNHGHTASHSANFSGGVGWTNVYMESASAALKETIDNE